jgi:hypothetical protein
MLRFLECLRPIPALVEQMETPMTDNQGAALRDEGIAQVKASNKAWFDDAIMYAAWWLKLRQGIDITGEDITRAVKQRFAALPPPPPQVWGALTRTLIKRKLLTPTGKRVPMKYPRSHARVTDVYRSITET